MPKVVSSASSSGSRRQRGRRVAPTLSEINVVPMVDVMLVLLIIFMVAAPMLQRGVEVNLPVAGRSQEIASEQVFVDLPVSYRDDRQVFVDLEPIRVDFLAERIRQLMLNRTDKRIYLRLKIQKDHSIRISTDDRNELPCDTMLFRIDSEIHGALLGDIVVDVQYSWCRLCVDASQ